MPTCLRALVPMLAAACVVAPTDARQAPATPGSAPVAPARTTAAPPRIDKLVDRVWIVEESGGTPPRGALYVFLSDNTLAVSSASRSPSMGTWAEDVNGLVVTERNVSTKIEVLELTGERLRLRVSPPRSAASEVTFTAAVKQAPPPQPVSPPPTPAAQPAVPLGIPYQCGADRIRVAMDEGKVYVVWNDGTSTVLRETGGADATATRRVYSDGQVRLVEDTSESFTRILFARAGFRPRPCTSAR